MDNPQWRLPGTLVLLAAFIASPSFAEEWGWPFPFTDGSSSKLIDYHEKIHDPDALQSVKGTSVRDVTWEAENFTLRMDEGVIYLEPLIDGYPAGAFFVGRGAVSYSPDGHKARRDMTLRFGKERLEGEPVESAYFFTTRGNSLLDQIGVEPQPAVAFEAQSDFEECKTALRQLGTRLTHTFLNREDLTEGAAYVLFVPPAIRTHRSPDAYLLYSFDPSHDHEIELHAFGHPEIDPRVRGGQNNDIPQSRYYFWAVARERSNPRRFVPEGRVEEYSTDLILRGMQDVREVSSITFTTVQRVSALRLELTPRLEVTSVTGPDGRALSFLQWHYRPNRENRDPHLVVFLDDLFVPGETGKITITSSGPLIQARALPEESSFVYYVAEEDLWHPRLNDPGATNFELTATVPKRARLVAAGELISEEVVAERRRYYYRTTRPSAATTFYYGKFRSGEKTADDTVVTVHSKVATPEDLEMTLTEMVNLVKVYNRILGPLESERLRVVAAPVNHGRAFDEVILLNHGWASYGWYINDRALVVARLWWGNLVRPRDLPEDGWLSDSFAQYLAFEYTSLRMKETDRDLLEAGWYRPTFEAIPVETQTLTGAPTSVDYSRAYALIDGVGTTTKGPLVLHSLRYLFEVRDGSDNAFWLLLHHFVEKYRGRQVSTREFLELAEEEYGEPLDWFWDQWLYGADLPVVRWSHDLTPTEDGAWLLTVDAEQLDTEMTLYIPIYVVMSEGETLREPLIMRGKKGQATIKLDSEPSGLSLNAFYEAIVELRN